MNPFDAEPYLPLFPKALVRGVGYGLLFVVAFVPPARDWFIDQAQEHVMARIQPILENLLEVPVVPAGTDNPTGVGEDISDAGEPGQPAHPRHGAR